MAKRTRYPIHPDFQKRAGMNPPLNRVFIPVMQKLMSLIPLGEWRNMARCTVRTLPLGTTCMHPPSRRQAWRSCPRHILRRRNLTVSGTAGSFMRRLRQFGVACELHNTEGTIHGFDIVLDSQIVRECVDRRIAFLKRVFAKP